MMKFTRTFFRWYQVWLGQFRSSFNSHLNIKPISMIRISIEIIVVMHKPDVDSLSDIKLITEKEGLPHKPIKLLKLF